MLWLALVGLTDQLVHDRITSGHGGLGGGEPTEQGCLLGHAAPPPLTCLACPLPPPCSAPVDKYEQYYLHYHRWDGRGGAPLPLLWGPAAEPAVQAARRGCALAPSPPSPNDPSTRTPHASHVTSGGHLDVATEREAGEGDGTLVPNTAIMCRIMPQVRRAARSGGGAGWGLKVRAGTA